LKATVKKRQKN